MRDSHEILIIITNKESFFYLNLLRNTGAAGGPFPRFLSTQRLNGPQLFAQISSMNVAVLIGAMGA
jgi:hypothetical protein